MRSELGGERIVTETADHTHGVSKPSYRHGLVRALAAGMNLKVVTGHSLALQRDALRAGYEVHVDAAHDHHRLLLSHHEFPSTTTT
jgi:hypothetical protein